MHQSELGVMVIYPWNFSIFFSWCSGQILTLSKRTTCVPHLLTLRGTSELSSEVYAIPDLLQVLRYEVSSVPKTSTLNQAAPAIVHP